VGSDDGEIGGRFIEESKSIGEDGPLARGENEFSVFTGICGELW
jgi:hypothetical protein